MCIRRIEGTDRRFTKDGEEGGKGREEKLSVPYKLINLGANNCPAWFRESQIGGVDLAVFRGHAFSATIRQCVCPDRGTAITPVNGSFLWLLARVCWHICKLLVTNYSSGSSFSRPPRSLLRGGGLRSAKLPLSPSSIFCYRLKSSKSVTILSFTLDSRLLKIRITINKREMRNKLRMFLRKYIKK